MLELWHLWLHYFIEVFERLLRSIYLLSTIRDRCICSVEWRQIMAVVSGIRPRSVVDEAQDELICPICCDFFDNPRSLGCLHSFCESCLFSLQSVSSTPDVLVCPECRTETALPPKGVTGKPANKSKKKKVRFKYAWPYMHAHFRAWDDHCLL